MRIIEQQAHDLAEDEKLVGDDASSSSETEEQIRGESGGK